MADKKYYWLKLKKDFFKRHDIRIVESMPNGKDYILFYLKMLLESIDHEGKLRFSETIPYNEEMLSIVTNTNVDIVHRAMEIFIELEMVEVKDDKTIFMQEVERLIGSETAGATRVREHRQRQKLLQCNTYVTECNESVTQSKSIEKEKEKELDVDVDCNGTGNRLKLQNGSLGRGVVLLTPEQDEFLLDKLGLDGYDHYISKLADFIIEKDAKVANHFKTILKWYEEDTKLCTH